MKQPFNYEFTTKELDSIVYKCYNHIGEPRHSDIVAIINAGLEIIQADPTVCLDRAPEGHQFQTSLRLVTVRNRDTGDSWEQMYSKLIPNPKPCPKPVLDGVPEVNIRTWQAVYGDVLPTIPDRYAAKFGRLEELKLEGYTHFILNNTGGIGEISPCFYADFRIALKVWNRV